MSRFAARLSLCALGCAAAVTALAAACNKDRGEPSALSPASKRLVLGNVSVAVPDPWVVQPTNANMRKAQYELPAAGGGAGPGKLVVYHFGPQGAGSVEENLERWYRQFTQDDGRHSKDVAVTEQLTAGGVAITLVDVSGRYVAQMTPGGEERNDEPNSRMLAAIFDGGQGAYYFKLVGPAKTVAHWRADFVAMLKSLQKSAPAAQP